MPTYLRPDVYVEEIVDATRPITGAGTSITGFMGIARRGPVGKPVLITSLPDFERIFGKALEGQALYYSVSGFFKNGGTACYVSRLAHYNDLSTAAIAADTAELACEGLGTPSGASVTSTIAAPYYNFTNVEVSVKFSPMGSTYYFEIYGNPANLTLSGGTYATGASPSGFTYSVNGAPSVVVDTAGVGGTAESWASYLNENIDGVSVTTDGSVLYFETDRKGSGASFSLVPYTGNIGTVIGLTTSVGDNGNGTVPDMSLVTFAQLKSAIEGQIGSDISVTQNADSTITLTNVDVLGASSYLQLSGDSAFPTITGVAYGTYAGSDNSPSTTLTVYAGYRGELSPGIYGNLLSVEISDDPLHTSFLANTAPTGDTQIRLTSLRGISAGTYLKIGSGLAVEYVEVSSALTAIEMGTVQHIVNLTQALEQTFSSETSVVSLEHSLTVRDGDTVLEVWRNLTMNPNKDNALAVSLNDERTGSQFVKVLDNSLSFPGRVLSTVPRTLLQGGTSEIYGLIEADIVGDANGKTGVYAFDEVQDLNLLTCAPSFGGFGPLYMSPLIHNALLTYCGQRMDCFAVLDCPEGLSPNDMAVYRTDYLGADSYWGALYYPFIQVPDPMGFGSNPTVFVPPSGHICGIYGRVDAIPAPSGGVGTAPAGVGDFGKVNNCVGLQTYLTDRDQDILNPLGVNCIRKFSRGGPVSPGIVVYGARTLSSVNQFKYIQVRRLMTFIEQSIRLSTRYAVFRNNDFRLWGQLTDLITAFLRGLHQSGQLQGNKASDAYFVKIDSTTTTPTNIQDGILVGEIGVSPQRPAEFIVFRFSQFQSGSSVSE